MVSAEVRTHKTRVAFKAPGVQVNGLEAVPEGLWLSDQQNNLTYLIDYDGKVLTSFPSPARNASGTSFGAGSVWVAANMRPAFIARHDPQTGHCLAVVHLPKADQGGVHGIQWRPYEPGEQPPAPAAPRPQLHQTAPGGRLSAGPGVSGTLWVTRPGMKVVDHIDAETGELLGQIPFPATRSHGLFWDEQGGTLSISETNHGHVYTLNPKSGEVLDEWRLDGVELHAMTRSADGRIWVGDAATNLVSVADL